MNVVGLSGVPSITVGGRVFTDLRNLIVLHGWLNAAGGANTSLRIANATSGYQVPASRTLRISAIRQEVITATAAFTSFGYTDNDVGMATATAAVNLVLSTGVGNGGGMLAVATGAIEKSYNFTIPTGKFVFVGTAGSAQVCAVTAFGYLE